MVLIYNLTERMYVVKFENDDGDNMSKKIKTVLHRINKNSRIQLISTNPHGWKSINQSIMEKKKLFLTVQ